MKLPWNKDMKEEMDISCSKEEFDKHIEEMQELNGSDPFGEEATEQIRRYNNILNQIEQYDIDKEDKLITEEIKKADIELREESIKLYESIKFTPSSEKSHIGSKPSLHVFDEVGRHDPNMNIGWREVPKIMKEDKNFLNKVNELVEQQEAAKIIMKQMTNEFQKEFTNITRGQLDYVIKSYPDGSKYVIVHRIDTRMVFKINSYEDLWILNQIHDVVKHAGSKVTVTIPNLIDGQADRRFDENKPHGLKLVCEFLNSMTNFSFKIFHPHNAEVVEALLDRVEIVDNFEFIDRILSYKIPKDEGLVILLPDGGAYKWGVKLADKLGFKGDVIAAAKNRQYIDGKSKLVQQLPEYDFNNKNVIVIDDISIKGGTFKGLSKLLKERNCGKLYLAVSHMTVQDLGEDPITDYFDRVFTTNSKYDRYTVRDIAKEVIYPENLEIINLF